MEGTREYAVANIKASEQSLATGSATGIAYFSTWFACHLAELHIAERRYLVYYVRECADMNRFLYYTAIPLDQKCIFANPSYGLSQSVIQSALGLILGSMLLGCRRHLCLLLLIVGGSVRPEPRGKDRRERQGRGTFDQVISTAHFSVNYSLLFTLSVFSLFSVVAFTNSACQTTSATTRCAKVTMSQ